MAANTGHSLGAEEWCSRADSRDVLAAQTERLAVILERNGIPTRQGQRAEVGPDGISRLIIDAPASITALGDVTGEADTMAQPYRAIRFLPIIAQRDRRPTLTALRYFQRHAEGGKYIRMAVVTSGARVALLGDLKARHREHSKNISRWASEARARYGVEVLLRSTEYTLSPSGVHLHSNLLYRPDHAIPKAKWRQFLVWSRGRLGHVVWKDCGRLRKPDEAIKYAYKPGEMEGYPDEVVCWLYGQHERTKLVQPMGSFAAFLLELEQQREKITSVCNGGAQKGKHLARVEKEERPARASSPSASTEPGENIILCRTLPQSRFTPWAEPISLVANFTRFPTTPEGWRRLAVLNERHDQATAWWIANGAPDIQTALQVGIGRRAAQGGSAGVVVPFRPTPRTDARQAPLLLVHTRRPTAQPPPEPKAPRATGTEADGTVYDRDTGEILFEPGERKAQQREEHHKADLASHEQTTLATAWPMVDPRKPVKQAKTVFYAPATYRIPPAFEDEMDIRTPW